MAVRHDRLSETCFRRKLPGDFAGFLCIAQPFRILCFWIWQSHPDMCSGIIIRRILYGYDDIYAWRWIAGRFSAISQKQSGTSKKYKIYRMNLVFAFFLSYTESRILLRTKGRLFKLREN